MVVEAKCGNCANWRRMEAQQIGECCGQGSLRAESFADEKVRWPTTSEADLCEEFEPRPA